jgi:hypothetical protein
MLYAVHQSNANACVQTSAVMLAIAVKGARESVSIKSEIFTQKIPIASPIPNLTICHHQLNVITVATNAHRVTHKTAKEGVWLCN